MNTQSNESTATEPGFRDEKFILANVVPVSRRTMKTLRDAGKIPFVQLGRRVLYDPAAVMAALHRMERNGQ